MRVAGYEVRGLCRGGLENASLAHCRTLAFTWRLRPNHRPHETRPNPVGRVPSRGACDEPSPRRLRRLFRVWPDCDGNISYLLTVCVDGRTPVLNNGIILARLVAFLLESPARYRWFGRRFVIMPDHIHLIAHMGHEAIPIGQWMKALKAVVGGLEIRATPDAGSGDPAFSRSPADVPHGLARIERGWRWQKSFHDHRIRSSESEAQKWEYVRLNPVRAGLVKRPEEWSYGGEIFHGDVGGPSWVPGTPPLL